jgi:hypothetical protein
MKSLVILSDLFKMNQIEVTLEIFHKLNDTDIFQVNFNENSN